MERYVLILLIKVQLSALTRRKCSSEVKTNSDNSVVKFNAWLINMLLFDYLRCMLALIIALSQSLNEYLAKFTLVTMSTSSTWMQASLRNGFTASPHTSRL